MLTDTYRHKGLRKRLIDHLRNDVGITDENVLEAMNKVPRHYFLDSSFDEIAYEDRAIQILCSQTISQPSTVAFQTQLLKLQPRMKVLEIGTGSGYQTAVLNALDAKIYTIERQKDLYNKANTIFQELKIHPQTFYGDGYAGLPGIAPFDRILVTCGAPFLPKNLLLQLKIGGILVIPVGEKVQKMLRLTRNSEQDFSQEEFGNFTFVPMLENKTK